MQDELQPSIESIGTMEFSPGGGFERLDEFVRWANGLEGKVNSIESAVRGLGDSLGQMREQIREINDSYREILDRHDQLVIYIQSSMQYCENKESINALFDASEENSLAAAALSKKLELLEDRITQAEEAVGGKMPLTQGEQLLKVLKIHHGKLTDLSDKLKE